MNQSYSGTAAEGLEQLAGYAVTEHTIDSALQSIVDLAGPAVGAEAVGISLVRQGKVVTAFSSKPKVLEIDLLQYDVGVGPCFQAMADGQTQIVDSLLDEHRWPTFANLALYEGVQSIIAYPLQSKTEVIGALNFYSARQGAFNDDAISLGRILPRELPPYCSTQPGTKQRSNLRSNSRRHFNHGR